MLNGFASVDDAEIGLGGVEGFYRCDLLGGGDGVGLVARSEVCIDVIS